MLREASSQPRSQKHRPRWSGVATACSALEQLCHPEQSIFQPLKTQGKAHHAGGRLLRVQITCALLPATAACFARIKSVSLANILVLAQHSPKRDFWLVFTVRHGGNALYKWKNHFVEMKGDVGMSVHEKGGKQVRATPTHKTIYNPIPTSL